MAADPHTRGESDRPGAPLPADLEDLPVHPSPVLAEELADTLPLVVRAGFEIGTIRRTGDLREAVLPTAGRTDQAVQGDRKSTRLNSSHGYISYAVFCLKKKKKKKIDISEMTKDEQR